MRLKINPERVNDIALQIQATRDDLAAPTFQSVESCGSLAVRDALSIASEMIIDEMVLGRRQVKYIVDSLAATVKDFEEAEEVAVRTINDLGKYIV
jgi:hypothetical protein